MLDDSEERVTCDFSNHCLCPPEAFCNEASLRSVVWFVGMLLYELAEGKNPYSGCSEAELRRRVCEEDPPVLQREHSPFADFVSQCLTKEPAKRPSLCDLMNVTLYVRE